MKIFSSSQVQNIDKYTIENEPISSLQLMERAANNLFGQFVAQFSTNIPILVFAGPGNNGGDALALSRLLLTHHYKVDIILLHEGVLSDDCDANRIKINEMYPDSLSEQMNELKIPSLKSPLLLVDGLFGSGLKRPLERCYAQAVRWMNDSGFNILSIDLPSGMMGEENPDLSVPMVRATYTFTLQFPKLAFFLPETAVLAGKWRVVDIELHPDIIKNMPAPYRLFTLDDAKSIYHHRMMFSHKGTYGHTLVIAGSHRMAGAAILTTKAVLRSGCGLVTTHVPSCNRNLLLSSVPEAMIQMDDGENYITSYLDDEKYKSIAIGPGLGKHSLTSQMFHDFLKNNNKRTVIDADALGMLAQNKDWLNEICPESILTPHIREFDNIFGQSSSHFRRIMKAQEMASLYHVIIVLKGKYTAIVQPDGIVSFNTSGNSGLSTAGSGDVLTGIIAGLLSQSYKPDEAARLGVYLHGLSADLLVGAQSEESIIASDIIENLGKAYLQMMQ